MRLRRDALFLDRRSAGRSLGLALLAARPELTSNSVVVGLPRGGVPVADEVATSLGVDLDIIIVRKVGTPGHEELAIGAVAPDGIEVLNDDVIVHLGLSEEVVSRAVADACVQLDDRVRRFGRGVRPTDIDGRTVVIVDDGVATGATVKAAIAVARAMGAASVAVALPVGPPDAVVELERLADAVVCLASPRSFRAVGAYYHDFDQTPDSEVTEAVARHRHP